MRNTLRFGLLGAVGCLVAALLGEVLLHATRLPPPVRPARPSRAVCVLIDCSASMGNAKLREVKRAAVRYVRRQDLDTDRMAVVGFGTRAHVGTALTHDLARVERAILEVADGGTTSMDAALITSLNLLLGARGERNILLFTDGEANVKALATGSALSCRESDIRIVAVGTGDADVDFLGRVTGDPALVFWTEAGNYAEGFRRAEKIIHRPPSMVEASAAAPLALGVLRIGAWTALLAVGIAIALVAGQGRRLRRRSMGLRRLAGAVAGSAVAGLLAGAAGQLLYVFLAIQFGETLALGVGVAAPVAGRLLAWTFLGGVLGRGMALFVPNLAPGRALLAGAAGGLAGGWGFATASAVLGERAGRLLGAPALGLAIGLMIALVETVFRRAWLEIDYGNDETESVALGAEPVVIGSDGGACTVYAAGAAPRACRYRLMGDRVVVEDLTTRRTNLVREGDSRDVGDVAVTVRSSSRAVRA